MAFPNRQGFRPTAAMDRYAYQCAKMGDDKTQAAVAREIGLAPPRVSKWKQIDGFEAWLEERIEYYRTPIHDLLEHIALKNLDNYRYWEAMALKFKYITRDNAENPEPVTAVSAVDKQTLMDLVKEARGEKK